MLTPGYFQSHSSRCDDNYPMMLMSSWLFSSEQHQWCHQLPKDICPVIGFSRWDHLWVSPLGFHFIFHNTQQESATLFFAGSSGIASSTVFCWLTSTSSTNSCQNQSIFRIEPHLLRSFSSVSSGATWRIVTKHNCHCTLWPLKECQLFCVHLKNNSSAL